ncbi:MAG: hypothetical protein OEL80_01255 [Desulfuromonadales bacterium]|nr:hypothetical protein [Desulfuromonadales bacterium]
MNQLRTFVIRRAFVVPMGLLIALTLALLAVCVIQGQPLAKIILLAVMIVPMAVLFVESAFRRIVIAQEGVTAFRPLRQRQILFADVTSLETVQVRSRVFMTLAAGDDDFLIISNSYGDFPALVASLLDAVPEGTVTEETGQMAKQPPLRHADIFTAWFAVIALVYVLLAQFRG